MLSLCGNNVLEGEIMRLRMDNLLSQPFRAIERLRLLKDDEGIGEQTAFLSPSTHIVISNLPQSGINFYFC